MKNFFNKLIMCFCDPHAVGPIIAALIAIIGVVSHKSNKSFDLLTEERLKIYNSLLDSYQKLVSYSSPECVPMIKLSDYIMEQEKLRGHLSTTELQEKYLWQEYDALYHAVVEYKSNITIESKRVLEERRRTVIIFTDIYLWTIWTYIQRLHKKVSEEQYNLLFDELFVQHYLKSKELNASTTTFFDKYPLEILVRHCSIENKCLICKICDFK